jgi:hypothetical protein
MRRLSRRALGALVVTLSLACVLPAQGTTYYVSAAKGKGRKGTKEEPVREISVITQELKPGDTVYIAGGNYSGRADCGSDQIPVTCTIVGGWNDDFTARDPWGAYKTVFTGDNKAKNWNFNARLWLNCRGQKEPGEIVIDGVIVDNGARNYYLDHEGDKVVRKGNPSTGNNATPESPGIYVDTPRGGMATITNCIVMNTAPTGGTGAIYAFGNENSMLTIKNNLVINNTGTGINCVSSWHPRDNKGFPTFTVSDNTVFFCWKFDPIATHGGSALKMDGDTVVTAHNNAFAFNDYYNVDNVKKSRNLTLKDNLFGIALGGDYQEFNTVLDLESFEEGAQLLGKDSGGNSDDKLTLAFDEKWAATYAQRNLLDRNKVEGSVKAKEGWQNELRAALGLPQQGHDVKADSDVWLHRLALESAIKVGANRILGKFGCQNPSTASAQPVK